MQEKDVNILSLIPQRPPFVMVDGLSSANDRSACAELLITTDNMFAENGEFAEAGIVEHMAQTCAAGMGYVNSEHQREKIRIGFLAAVRNIAISRLPKVGEILQTRVSIVEYIMGMALVRSQTMVNGETIAEGEMKIFIMDIGNEGTI